jgi:hypothetical protein
MPLFPMLSDTPFARRIRFWKRKGIRRSLPPSGADYRDHQGLSRLRPADFDPDPTWHRRASRTYYSAVLRMFLGVGLSVVALASAAIAAPYMPLIEVEVFNSGTSEYVYIDNLSDLAASTKGWILASGVGGQKFQLGTTEIAPGASLRIVSGRTTAAQDGDMFWTKQNVWNNDGDVARLYDADGSLRAAAFEYGRSRTTSATPPSIKGTRIRR